MCAADQDPGAPVGSPDLEDEDLDPVCGMQVFAGNLFLLVQDAVRAPQIHTDIAADIALYDAGDDGPLLLAVFIKDSAALFLSDLLQDHIFRDLGGDPAEIPAVDLHADDISDLCCLLNLRGILKRDLFQTVLNFLGSFHDGFFRAAGVGKGIPVNIYLDVLCLAEMAFAGGDQSILNCGKQSLAADFLLFFEGEDRLFQLSIHAVSFYNFRCHQK